MRLVYITLARKILCYGSFPAKVSLGTNAYNSQNENDDSYDNLAKQLTGVHTIKDVIKWNNLAYKFLEASARKKKV